MAYVPVPTHPFRKYGQRAAKAAQAARKRKVYACCRRCGEPDGRPHMKWCEKLRLEEEDDELEIP